MGANGLFSEKVKIVKGLTPSADLYDGDPATDIVNMKHFNRCTFLLHQVTAGTNTGDAVVTVESSDDVSGSTTTAIPFKYRKLTTGVSDAIGAVTDATASGFTTTANEDTVYEITVQDADLPDGQPFCRAVFTEATDDPCIGSVVILLEGARYKEPDTPSALV